MKLSRAIRKGVKADGVQTFGELIDYDDNNNIVGCCTLGAAYIGALGLDGAKKWDRVGGDDPFITVLEKMVPVEDLPKGFNHYYGRDLAGVIISLNDKKGWSREKIATYLEKIGY